MNKAVELLPCPFCGSSGEVIPVRGIGWTEWTVECQYKECRAKRVCHVNPKIAIALWNARATPSLEAIIAKIEAEKVVRPDHGDYNEFGRGERIGNNKMADKTISIIQSIKEGKTNE